MNTDFQKKVVMIRIVTGEVIMGMSYVDSFDGNDSIKLEKAVLLGVSMGNGNQINVTMMDYIPFSEDENFEFPKSSVLHIMKPNKGLEAKFRQKNSGLVTPPNGIIT